MARDPLDRDYQGPGVFSHTVTEKNDFGGPGRAGHEDQVEPDDVVEAVGSAPAARSRSGRFPVPGTGAALVPRGSNDVPLLRLPVLQGPHQRLLTRVLRILLTKC